MAVSRRLRFEILRRDGHTCRYCGMKAPDVALTVDHVIPVALGGGDEPNNLVAACTDCNNGKSSVPADAQLVEDVDAAAMLWARAMETATERRREEISVIAATVDEVDHRWCEWKTSDGATVERPSDWRASVERWVVAGLDELDLLRLIDIAMQWGNARAFTDWRVWKYFCGCCWGELGDRQEAARRLIEDGSV